MIRRATQEETAIVRGSLEAVQRGLFAGFLSGKVLGIVEHDEAPPEPSTSAGANGSGAETRARGSTADAGAAGSTADAGARPSADAAASGSPARGRPRAVVLVDGGVLAMPEALRQGATGGLQVGVLADGFALDLQGAVVMARETRRQAIRVNEKATRLFLYGRDILGTSILEFDPSLQRGDHCIVTNPRREALGIGRVVGNFKAPRSAVEAVHDLGSYLRDE